MGGAEDQAANLFGPDLFLHIGQIHPEHPLLIPYQGGTHQAAAGIGNAVGKTGIVGQVDQYPLARLGQGLDGRHNGAHGGVLALDILRFQVGDAPAGPGPIHHRLGKAGVGITIAEGGMFQPLADGVGDAGRGGEVHIRDPHGDQGLILGHRVQGLIPLGAIAPAVYDLIELIHGVLLLPENSGPFSYTGRGRWAPCSQ